MKYTNKEMLDTLTSLYKEDGIAPSSTDDRHPHKNLYTRRFGSWSEALQLAGVPARPRAEKIVNLCGYCEKEVPTTVSQNKQFCNIQCSNKSRRGDNFTVRQTRDDWLKEVRSTSFDKMMSAPFESLGWDLMRRRILVEQNDVCNKCGIKEWQNVPLVLEIDHIDGDRTNNVRDNLEGLCPNCHSITETYKGRNKRSMRGRYTDEEKLEAYAQTKNLHQALLLLGMAPKGANYANMKRLIEEQE